MKTTFDQFKIFKVECEKWIGRFGLLGWRFYFQHKNQEDDCIAYINWPKDSEDRVFTIGLTLDIPERVFSLIDIKKAAFHEVMEALLYKIQNLAQDRYVKPSEIREEIHNLVRIFENVVWEKG